MQGMTIQGMDDCLDIVLRGATPPTKLYFALVTDTPGKNTQKLSDLTEIASGNGYVSGGTQLSRNTSDFPSLIKGVNDAVAYLRTIQYTASGGKIPSSGNKAKYAVLTTDEGTVGDRRVWWWWELSQETEVVDGQTVQIEDMGAGIKVSS